MTVDFAIWIFVSEVSKTFDDPAKLSRQSICLFEISIKKDFNVSEHSCFANLGSQRCKEPCMQVNIFKIKAPYRIKPFSSCALCSEMSLFPKYYILICPFPFIIYDIEKSSKNKGFITWLIAALMRSLFIQEE